MTSSASRLMRGRRIDFPVELFACGIRQDARRLFMPLMCALSLLVTFLVLWAAWEAVGAGRRMQAGAALLPGFTGAVFVEMLVFLGLNVPFALRAATADDDLPLVMLTGLTPQAIWWARVGTAALPALAIPLVHIPVMLLLYTLGGVRLGDIGSVAIFWLAGWCLSTGWSALAGSMWAGAARDRIQGLALTFLLVFLYGVGLGIIVRLLAWMNSPWTGWVLQSLQPPWHGTLPEFARLGAHVLLGVCAAWVSVRIVRGRWRAAVEADSKVFAEISRESHTITGMRPDGSESLPSGENRVPQRPRCGNDPWFWKDFHISGGGWWYWWCRMVTAGLLTVLAFFFCTRSLSGRYVEPVVVLTMLGWFIWMMFEIGQVLTIEFQDRMWSLVRITPTPVSTILWSKLKACACRFLPAFLPFGAVMFYGLTSYASMVVIVGVPLLFLVSLPFAVLILYGSAIPQTLTGAGWPMVKTLVPVGVVLFLVVFLASHSDRIPREFRAIAYFTIAGVLSVSTTVWLYYCTLCELNNPSRERLSSDGG